MGETGDAPLSLPKVGEERQRKFDNGLVISISRGGTLLGGDVWKSAHCVQRFLSANASTMVVGKRVCELGAGTGYLAMSAHLLGSSLCVATDRGQVLGLCNTNLRENDELLRLANPSGQLECCACDWEIVQSSGALPEELVNRASASPFDLILASDCLYLTKNAVAVLSVLTRLLAQSSSAECLLCQSYRGAPDVEQVFFELAAAAGISSNLVSQDEKLSPDRAALKQMNVCIWRLTQDVPSVQARATPAPLPPPMLDDYPASSLAELVEIRYGLDGRTLWAFCSTKGAGFRAKNEVHWLTYM